MSESFEFNLPPTADVVFQYLFSGPGAEPGLLSFINAVNGSSHRELVKQVTIQNPFNLANFVGDKRTIVDVKVKDCRDRLYDIEMQRLSVPYFPERTLYYWSKLYDSQLPEGVDYSELHKTISIIVAQFELYPRLRGPHNVFTIRAESDPSVCFSDHLEIHTLELIEKKLGFSLSVEGGNRSFYQDLHNWLDYLMHGNSKTEAEMAELVSQTPALAGVHRLYRQFTQSEQMREVAISRDKAERDWSARSKTSWSEGHEAGRIEENIKLLLILLQKHYSTQFTSVWSDRITRITDLDLLNALFVAAVSGKPFEEIAGLVK